MTIEEILAAHDAEWQQLQDGADLMIGTSPLMTALYEYFLETNEMPYDVAKARTGDPDLWIFDRLESYMSL